MRQLFLQISTNICVFIVLVVLVCSLIFSPACLSSMCSLWGIAYICYNLFTLKLAISPCTGMKRWHVCGVGQCLVRAGGSRFSSFGPSAMGGCNWKTFARHSVSSLIWYSSDPKSVRKQTFLYKHPFCGVLLGQYKQTANSAFCPCSSFHC